KLDGDRLGARVGGDDAPGEVEPSVFRPNLYLSEPSLNLLHRQRAANDPGGRDEHERRIDAEPFCGKLRHAARIAHTTLAVGTVAVAAVDHNALSAIPGCVKLLTVEDNRVRWALAGRERAGRSTRHIRAEQSEIGRSGLRLNTA